MQVNPEDSPPEIYVRWSDPRMTDFENPLPFFHSTLNFCAGLLAYIFSYFLS